MGLVHIKGTYHYISYMTGFVAVSEICFCTLRVVASMIREETGRVSEAGVVIHF